VRTAPLVELINLQVICKQKPRFIKTRSLARSFTATTPRRNPPPCR
jgi:hypothetical protein